MFFDTDIEDAPETLKVDHIAPHMRKRYQSLIEQGRWDLLEEEFEHEGRCTCIDTSDPRPCTAAVCESLG